MSDSDSPLTEPILVMQDITGRVPLQTLPSVPELVPVLEELFATVSSEIAGADSAEQGDALRVRAALIALDGMGDRARALDVLADAEHPLTPALRLGLGQAPVTTRDRESMLAAPDWAVGAAYLFARGAYAEAAELAERGGTVGATIRRICLGILGQWEEIVRLAEVVDHGNLVAEAAAIASDRLDDSNHAVSLLRRLSDQRPSAYVLERLSELGDRPGEVLRQKLDRLEPSAAPERVATAFLLAQALEEAGSESEAEQLVVTAIVESGSSLGLVLLGQRSLARLAAKRGDWHRAAEAWEGLARESGSPSFESAYLRRAAELWDARVGAADRAVALFSRLHEADPGDVAIASAMVRLLVRQGALAEVGGVLTKMGASREEGTHAGLLLAALLVEVSPEAKPNAALWRDWADAVAAMQWDDAQAIAARTHAFEAVARGLRGLSTRKALIEHYRVAAPLLEPRRAAAYLAVAGVLALEENLLEVAGVLFDEAASREPDDLLVHAGRVALYERTARYAELAKALGALVRIVESTSAQASLHRKLARVSIEQLNDVATAHESYERLLEINPEDVSVVESFVRLCAEGSKWARAIELAERAATLTEGDRAAELLRYAGDITERNLADDDAALRFYERALERSRTFAPALSAMAALHKKHNRVELHLSTLKLLLDTKPTQERRIEVLLEYARAAERADGDAAGHDFGRAYAAYEEVLSIEPAQAIALPGIERLCRAGGRWAELAELYARAPDSLRTLRVRCECMEHLERWAELSKLREHELQFLEVPAEVAVAARALAELYEGRLHNAEAAVRSWARVSKASPTEAEPMRAEQRLHEAAGRHPQLAEAIERELALGEALDSARRVELWTKLGELRKGPLKNPGEAARAFEEVLRLDPRRAEVVEQLVALYKTLGRGDDLARMLDVRAAASNNPQQRANTLREKAELLESEGDLPRALAAYQEAFTLDPESRACFTAYEKLCYKAERWKQALELYDAAIKLVEDKNSRAYRLADLYSRRGQLQMQYLGALGEATASYKRVLELDPENDTSQAALERIFSAQSDWSGLIGVYEARAAAMKTDARRVEVLRRAARVAGSKMRDAAEASRLYECLHTVDPTDSEAADTLERYYDRAKRYDKLVGILRTRLSLTAGGDEAIALYLRIAQLCEEGLRDADQTIEAYQRVLEIAPSNREAIDALGRLYEGTERWAELVEVTRRQIRLVTDRAQKALLYFKCGSVMESKFGKEDDAIRYYDAAIKTSPSCLPAVHGLRDLHLRRQDWPRVIQTLELEAKLWTEDKERAGVYAHMGQIYGERLGDTARAAQYYETALQVDRECLPANKALFELYSARGDYQQALALAAVLTQKVSREGDPVERSEFYRKRSIVAENTGDTRAAVDSLVVALEIRPDNLDALDMLVALCRSSPDAYDYETTFRELEKVHRKRDLPEALARVVVAQASLLELNYDIDGAEAGYKEALQLAPMDFTIVEPLVALNERLRRFDAAEALIETFLEGVTDMTARATARLRLASLCGDAMMDAERAAEVLGSLLAEDPNHKEALFLYSQELYLLGRYPEARTMNDKLVEIATAPEHTAPPEELARYYDYLGRILEASGDQAGSTRAFRRAVDLDPTYPPAGLALARRAAATGDLVQGTRVLADALEAAEASGKLEAVLTLQRSRARFLVTWGELGLAAQAFRSLLEKEPDSVDDRLAYADLLGRSEQTVPQAFAELEHVISLEPRHSQAYRQLAQLYQRVGQVARAGRVFRLMFLMGLLEPSDRAPAVPPVPRRAVLSDELRGQYVAPGARGPLLEALAAVREPLEDAYPFVAPSDAVNLLQVGDPALRSLVQDLERVFGVSAEVYVAPDVPGGFLVNELPKPVIYLSRDLLDSATRHGEQGAGAERRVLLGSALEALRGGYGLLTRVPIDARSEITNLLGQLVRPEHERSAEAQSYVRALPRKSQKALEKLWTAGKRNTLPPGALSSGLSSDSQSNSLSPSLPSGAVATPEAIARWLEDLERSMQRAALIASDDLAACTRVFSRPGATPGAAIKEVVVAVPGEAPKRLRMRDTTDAAELAALNDELALMGDAILSLDRGAKVQDLVTFYLSGPYDNLRQTIGDAA
ncbi:MAG: hypothetical protein ABI321_23465 [Polyangia bacterium]